MSKQVKVLVVDDSRTSRQMLSGIIGQAPDIEVVGQAENGSRALELTKQLRPDVILMDIIMPDMDGLEATSLIMAECPTPIILITASLDAHEADVAFRAIKVGALTVMQKPAGPMSRGEIQGLLSSLRAMSDVRVIHHHGRRLPGHDPVPSKLPKTGSLLAAPRPELIAIVASTGGPGALSEIIRQLPPGFDVPIVIVQHIAPDFVGSLVSWFSSITPLKVAVAESGKVPQPGVIYVAPGNTHLRLDGRSRFVFDRRQGLSPHMPSGDVLFESVAESYGSRAVGVLLTGMGADGARGLRMMYDVNAYTIAQDETTSVVFGMPAEAIKLNAARKVLPIQSIATALTRLIKDSKEVEHEA